MTVIAFTDIWHIRKQKKSIKFTRIERKAIILVNNFKKFDIFTEDICDNLNFI